MKAYCSARTTTLHGTIDQSSNETARLHES